MTILLLVLVIVLAESLVKATKTIEAVKNEKAELTFDLMSANKAVKTLTVEGEAKDMIIEELSNQLASSVAREAVLKAELETAMDNIDMLNTRVEVLKVKADVLKMELETANKLASELKAIEEINNAFAPVNKELISFLVEDKYFDDEIVAEEIDGIALELQSKYMSNEKLNNFIVAKWDEAAELLGVVQKKDSKIEALEWQLDMQHAANEYWYGDTDTAELME